MLNRDKINKGLSLIIMPTEKCNFRCTYCYEDFAIGKMKRPVIEGVKALVTRRVEQLGLEKLSFSWFGGEPLLAKDVMFELSEFANGLVEAGKLHHFEGSTTTNASFLTLDTLARLTRARQTFFQISLDGYREGHDETRRHATGVGTFDRIWDNLVAAHESDLDFEILLRLHLTDRNLASMGKLIDLIATEMKGDTRFSVLFKRIEDYGGENGASITALSPELATVAVRDFVRTLDAAGLASEDGATSEYESMGATMGREAEDPEQAGCGYVCYAAKPWSFVVRANGTISKCTVDLTRDVNILGTLDPSGLMKIDNDKMAYWMRGYYSGNPDVLGCPAHAKVAA